MSKEKQQMVEAAILYYEKKHTQQEIAQAMQLSRQTVSKLLSDALSERIVEIKIHNPEEECAQLERALCARFGLQRAVVCSIGAKSEAVCRLMTVRKAAEYLLPILQEGGRKIALSWGRTLQTLVEEFPSVRFCGNTVFPLFGATDSEKTCFLSNELARGFADKIGAEVKYAWFPYRPDQAEDCALLKKTSYYQKINALWEQVDVAIVGIGNAAVLRMFEDVFGYQEDESRAVGDIATHLFAQDGTLIPQYRNALCASVENLRRAQETVAIACSSPENDKVDAIVGGLRTGLIDTLVTDEHTARRVMEKAGEESTRRSVLEGRSL